MTIAKKVIDTASGLSRLEWGVIGVATCVVVAFGVQVGMVSWQVGQDAGLSVPTGPNRSLWGLAVMAAVTGGTQSLPPLLPVLAFQLGGASGPVQGALLANAIAYGASISLVGATLGLLCRNVWAGAGASIGGTVLAANLISVGPYQWFLQPEMLCMFTVTACACSALLLVRTERWWAAVLFGACCAWAFASKEHGLVVLAAAIPAVFLLVRGDWKKRLGAFALLVLGLQLGTNLVTGTPTEPFFLNRGTPHGTWVKARVHLQHSADILTGDMGSREALPVKDEKQLEQARGRGMTRLMVRQALSVAGPVGPLAGWGVLSLVVLLGMKRGREALALGVALSPFLSMVVIFAEWRHLMVMWPLALAASVTGLVVLADRFLPRVGAVLLLVAGVYGGQLHATSWTARMSDSIREAMVFQQSERGPVEVSRWLLSNALDESLLSAPDLVVIITGIRPAILDDADVALREPLRTWPSVLWRTYYVSEKEPGAAWKKVYTVPDGRLAIYRMHRTGLVEEQGIDERCLYGVLDTSKPIPLKMPHGLARPEPEPAEDCPDGG